MSTDRELLELAAKAAGYDVDFAEDINGYYPHGVDADGYVGAWWNPLTGDGDALRLAVKLNIMVSPYVGEHAAAESQTDDEVTEKHSDHGGDQYAAQRRAIVRAAAAIGEAMP